VSPSLSILSVLVARVSNKSIAIPITLRESQKDRENVKLEALLDSGAGGLFIDVTFVKENGFALCGLPEPLNAYNLDGTLNKKGTITSCVEADLQISEQITKTRLYITGLGKQKVILGFPWLRDENPDVDWKTCEIRWKRVERRKLGKKAIKLTQARLAKLKPVEKQTYPAALVEDAVDHEEDRTRYPIPNWYPPDAIIITAEEQKNFEEYTRNLLANPVSKIHKTMKCLDAQINHIEIDIGQIEFDTSQEEFDDNALLISYINGKATEELDDICVRATAGSEAGD